MQKTTVYLDDDTVEGLRSMAATTGRSQAELIREGVRRLVAGRPVRRFHSLGKGKGPGEPAPRWDARELYEKAFGQR